MSEKHAGKHNFQRHALVATFVMTAIASWAYAIGKEPAFLRSQVRQVQNGVSTQQGDCGCSIVEPSR